MQRLGNDFYARYRALARAWARNVLGPALEVDDVVQEAMLAVHRKSLSCDFHSTEHARNFLLRSVHGGALAARRDRGRRASQEFAQEPMAPSERSRTEDGSRLLFRLLGELEADERDLLVRRYLRRETLDSISSATGHPISTLHSRERALLARLHRTWKQNYQEDAS